MVKVTVDISPIQNAVNQIHNELFATHNMTDNQRRDKVSQIIEKLKDLKTALENRTIEAYLK